VEVTAGEAGQRLRLPEVEVVRLGGSLLLPADESNVSLDTLRDRLSRWTRDRPSCRIWIVGTGAWGDHLRRVQAPLRLSDEACHWAAIGLMSVASRLAAELIEGAEAIGSFSDLRDAISRRTQPREIVFDATQFLQEIESTLAGPVLPQDWSVTSDSIAARVAAAIEADALTLLKACLAPERRDPQAWSEQGLVDEFFPQVACERRELRWVDLSTDPPAERRYRSK
jgi:dihydroneopterin aldolase